MKVALQHVLVKKLQVLYRNGLLKHPKKKAVLMKPCIFIYLFSAGVTAAELQGRK